MGRGTPQAGAGAAIGAAGAAAAAGTVATGAGAAARTANAGAAAGPDAAEPAPTTGAEAAAVTDPGGVFTTGALTAASPLKMVAATILKVAGSGIVHPNCAAI